MWLTIFMAIRTLNASALYQHLQPLETEIQTTTSQWSKSVTISTSFCGSRQSKPSQRISNRRLSRKSQHEATKHMFNMSFLCYNEKQDYKKWSEVCVMGNASRDQGTIIRLLNKFPHDMFLQLLVTKLVSRFVRNTVDSLTTVRKLKDKGIEIYFEKENIWTLDAKGELLITIMSSLAQ